MSAPARPVMVPRAWAAGVIATVLVIVGVFAAAMSFGGRSAQAVAAHVPVASSTAGTGGLRTILNAGGALSAPATGAPAAVLLKDHYAAPPGSSGYKVSLDGVEHYYRLHRATSVPAGTPRPLLLVLPGWRRSAEDSEQSFGFDVLTGVDVAYVDGDHNSWDAGTCCGYAAAQHLDDLSSLHQIVDVIAKTEAVDRSHVVLAGFSNGGMLALRAGCEQAPELAGIIVASGSLQVSSCAPAVPLTVVTGHGGKDVTVPIGGLAYNGYLHGPITSQAASLAPFLAEDACGDTTVTQRGDYSVTRNRACAGGVLIDDYVDGAIGHKWPDAVPGGASFAVTAWGLVRDRASAVPFAP